MQIDSPEIKTSLFSNQSANRFFIGPKSFVATVWLTMFLIPLAFVIIYGHNIPIAEDWTMVAALTNNEPNLASWLWTQNNEHRIPLPKLILLGILKLSNVDFRAGMILNILCIGLVAGCLLKVFYRLRGGITRYTDAFFPIVLLHLGNWENLFWSWEFTFILATIFTCILIGLAVKYKGPLGIGEATLASLCMVSLPLCGANGLLCLVPVIPWLSIEAYIQIRAKEAGATRKTGFVLITAIAVTIAIVISYFINYVRPAWYPPSPSLIATLSTSIKFMSLAFGPVAEVSWKVFSCITILLLTSTSILLCYKLFTSRGAELRKALGLLLFLGGSIVFALAMGYGRATAVPTVGLPMRYVLLAVPILIICYGSWENYGSPLLRKSTQWGLFLIVFALVFHNSRRGLHWGRWCSQGVNDVLQDIEKGVPHSQLVTRNQEFLLHWNKTMLYEGMKQLKQADIEPFKHMLEDK